MASPAGPDGLGGNPPLQQLGEILVFVGTLGLGFAYGFAYMASRVTNMAFGTEDLIIPAIHCDPSPDLETVQLA